jgi:hypothetical protein
MLFCATIDFFIKDIFAFHAIDIATVISLIFVITPQPLRLSPYAFDAAVDTLSPTPPAIATFS